MGERKYLMADVAKKLDIPPYMLRYYEDALAINIPRNERGLRYYRKQEIELFTSVMNLRQKGFDIASIRMVLDDIHRIEKLPPDKLLELRDKLDAVMGKRSLDDGEQVIDSIGEAVTGKESENNLIKKKFASGSRGNFESSELSTVQRTNAPENAKSSSGEILSAEDKMQQFRNIMTGIVLDALKMNNEDLGQRIKYTVTDSVVKEMSYLMKKQDETSEERFKSIDKRLREVCAASEKNKVINKKEK